MWGELFQTLIAASFADGTIIIDLLITKDCVLNDFSLVLVIVASSTCVNWSEVTKN